MKIQRLRKKLLFESGVIAAVTLVMACSSYFLYSMQESYTASKGSLEAQVNSVTNETNGLRENFIRVQKDIELYQKITVLNDSEMLSHSTNIVSDKLKEYENIYNLHDWNFGSEFAKGAQDDAKYRRKTSHIAVRSAVYNLHAASDEDVYSLIMSLQKDMPGAVSFTSINISRQGNVTDEALRAITKNGSFPLVNADIKFSWLAIEPNEPKDNKKPDPKNRKRPK